MINRKESRKRSDVTKRKESDGFFVVRLILPPPTRAAKTSLLRARNTNKTHERRINKPNVFNNIWYKCFILAKMRVIQAMIGSLKYGMH